MKFRFFFRRDWCVAQIWKSNNWSQSETLNVWHDFTYTYHVNWPNVGINIPHIECLGMDLDSWMLGIFVHTDCTANGTPGFPAHLAYQQNTQFTFEWWRGHGLSLFSGRVGKHLRTPWIGLPKSGRREVVENPTETKKVGGWPPTNHLRFTQKTIWDETFEICTTKKPSYFAWHWLFNGNPYNG